MQEADHAGRVLDREIKDLTAQHGPRRPVTGQVVEGRAADVLTTAAHSADLLVLGSQRHSRVRRTVLGSVSEECSRKAHCPVVVIPTPPEQPADESVLST